MPPPPPPTQYLVIVESPAKCSKIASFLGQQYKVIASFGHIRALQEGLDSIGITRDFEPLFEFQKEKAKAIKTIKDAAIGCKPDNIYLAADDDREGEAIAYSVALLLHLDLKKTKRSVFHEITETAVRRAIAEPRHLDMNRIFAQQSRAMLDMMVGFTISPLLWKHVSQGASLSAGRCQTPALRLICEREKEICGFKSEASWKISGNWLAANTITKLDIQAILRDELSDEESATNYLENHHTDTGASITSAITSPWTEKPPEPLITSTLQQQASTLFRSNPKATMRIAQRLYEAGYITYMRTDSIILSEEAVKEARGLVEKRYGVEFLGGGQATKTKVETKFKSKASVAAAIPAAQEAHEAIRPTHFSCQELPSEEEWGFTDRRVYRLIWLRAVQSVMAVATGETRKIQFVAVDDDPEDWIWENEWRRTTFMGWKKADTKETQGQEVSVTDASAAIWSAAIGLKIGDKLNWKTLEASPYNTKPLQRYTEASLVRELEKRGIGRPSTFASLIDTIINKNYGEVKDIAGSERTTKTLTLKKPGQWPPTQETKKVMVGAEKDKMIPSPLGLTVIDFVLVHFADLFDYKFTALMESRLDKIAVGDEPWKSVLKDTWDSYKERYETLKKSTSVSAGTGSTGSSHKKEFGDGLIAVMTKKGPLLLREASTGDDTDTKPKKSEAIFYGWPSGTSFEDMTPLLAEEFCKKSSAERTTTILGEYNGNQLVKKTGQFGEFVECNTIKVPYVEGDTVAILIAKIETKSASFIRKLGDFQFNTGPYGPYMFKTAGVAKKVFVSIPEDVDILTLSEDAATALYKIGLEAKARKRHFAGGRGGRGGKK